MLGRGLAGADSGKHLLDHLESAGKRQSGMLMGVHPVRCFGLIGWFGDFQSLKPNPDEHRIQPIEASHLVAEELLSAAQQHFVRPPSWWRTARDLDGNAVGFVLPVLFKEPEPDPHGLARPEGTIFHLGVLPKFRGHGFARDLIAEATRICSSAGCWRVFCDTSSNNSPMLDAFRQTAYSELMPWQRPLA